MSTVGAQTVDRRRQPHSPVTGIPRIRLRQSTVARRRTNIAASVDAAAELPGLEVESARIHQTPGLFQLYLELPALAGLRNDVVLVPVQTQQTRPPAGIILDLGRFQVKADTAGVDFRQVGYHATQQRHPIVVSLQQPMIQILLQQRGGP